LGSRNGTALNGKRVEGPATLKAGDRIAIGSELIEVVETSVPADVVSTVERQLREGQTPTRSFAPLAEDKP
jgi:pSer/pThr/pTyr-binding forkhead associated (FHA) protein